MKFIENFELLLHAEKNLMIQFINCLTHTKNSTAQFVGKFRLGGVH